MSKKVSLGVERNKERADRMDCTEVSNKESRDCLGRKLVLGHTLKSCKLDTSAYAYSKSYSNFSKSTNPTYANTCNWDSTMNAVNAKNSWRMPLYSPERTALTREN